MKGNGSMNGFMLRKWIEKNAISSPVFTLLNTPILMLALQPFFRLVFANEKINLIFLTKEIEWLRGREELLKAFIVGVGIAMSAIISLNLYRMFIGRLVFHFGLLPKKNEENELLEEDTEDNDVTQPEFPYNPEKLQIIVGLKHRRFDLKKVKNPEYVVIPKNGMFQNFLITGTIGTGKTASVMYPFLKQALFYKPYSEEEKAGMLILDVKGNFYAEAVKYAKECGRADDIVLIQLDGEEKYNPLHKPELEHVDLAGRSKTVLELFNSGSKGEAFWDIKAGQMMTECVRLLRLVDDYVSLAMIHRLVTDNEYLAKKIDLLKAMESEGQVESDDFDYKNCINYFESEFCSEAETTIETIKACVTQMTAFFASSERINRAFCPTEDEVTFTGFEECINNGKIVVLAMNKAQYPEVAKTIAAYLKLDFQSEVQQRTSKDRKIPINQVRPLFFICDEYQEFVTKNDGAFYGLSRESKCCAIVSSQSYTSLLQTLGIKEAFDTLIQNLINKIWLRTDDELTVQKAQFLTGKEEKEKFSKNFSESSNSVKFDKTFGDFKSAKNGGSYSEGFSVSTQKEAAFDEKIFTQTLKMFTGVVFPAVEDGIGEPTIVHLLPYFREPISDLVPMLTSPAIIKLKTETKETKTNTNMHNEGGKENEIITSKISFV